MLLMRPEIYPKPEFEFERVQPRSPETEEALPCGITVQSLSFHHEVAATFDEAELNQLILNTSEDNEPPLETLLSPAKLNTVNQGYEGFKRALRDINYLQDNERVIRTMTDALSGFRSEAYRNHLFYDETPSKVDYLIIISWLRNGVDATAAALQEYAPIALPQLKEFLSQQRILGKQTFDSRTQYVDIVVVDPLTELLANNKNKSTAGWYQDQRIVVSSGSHDTRRTFIHEVLHQLSGHGSFKVTNNGSRELQMSSLIEGYNVRSGEQIIAQRIGWRILNFEQEDSASRFKWLNEAVTSELEFRYSEFEFKQLHPDEESLIYNIVGQKMDESTSYEQERDLMHALLKSGEKAIPFKRLAKAYFADTIPGEPDSTRPLREFIREVSSSYGTNNYLTKLDKIVQAGGVEAGIHSVITDAVLMR
jgi:hypothetical protein